MHLSFNILLIETHHTILFMIYDKLIIHCFLLQDKTVVVADFGLARIMPQNNWTAERKKFGKRHARKKR